MDPRISAVHVIPSVSGDTGGYSAVPGPPLQTSSSAVAPLCPFVLLWPSTRRSWRPQGSLWHGRSSWQTWFPQWRVPWSRSSEKRAPGCPPASWSGTLTSLAVAPTQGVSRSWQRGWPSSEECNMPSMQLWCLPHHCDGTPLKKADTMCGIALQHARKRKEDRYPELCGLVGRARLSRWFFFDVMFCVCFLTLIVMVCNGFLHLGVFTARSRATSCRFYIFVAGHHFTLLSYFSLWTS